MRDAAGLVAGLGGFDLSEAFGSDPAAAPCCARPIEEHARMISKTSRRVPVNTNVRPDASVTNVELTRQPGFADGNMLA
jgi:hypothetical protein